MCVCAPAYGQSIIGPLLVPFLTACVDLGACERTTDEILVKLKTKVLRGTHPARTIAQRTASPTHTHTPAQERHENTSGASCFSASSSPRCPMRQANICGRRFGDLRLGLSFVCASRSIKTSAAQCVRELECVCVCVQCMAIAKFCRRGIDQPFRFVFVSD